VHNTHTMSALALFALVACGEDADAPADAAPAAVEVGGAPIYLGPDDRLPALSPEPGYGWTVLHCRMSGPEEHCADASDTYGLIDGRLHHCNGVDKRNGGLDICTTGPIGTARYVRLH